MPRMDPKICRSCARIRAVKKCTSLRCWRSWWCFLERSVLRAATLPPRKRPLNYRSTVVLRTRRQMLPRRRIPHTVNCDRFTITNINTNADSKPERYPNGNARNDRDSNSCNQDSADTDVAFVGRSEYIFGSETDDQQDGDRAIIILDERERRALQCVPVAQVVLGGV